MIWEIINLLDNIYKVMSGMFIIVKAMSQGI